MFLQIVKTPEGDAPEIYREAWRGLIFSVDPSDVFEANQGTEYSIHCEPIPPRKHFVVGSRTALILLGLNSLEAVGFFVGSWPENMYYKQISFGWDEVVELPNNHETLAQYRLQFLQVAKRGICDDD